MTGRFSDPDEEKTAAPPPGDPALRQQIEALVKRVPRYAIRTVIEEVERVSGANSPRALLLREVLVDHFNAMRPYKARRLFTSLFEPLLADDPILLRAVDPVPGLLLRFDMGGLWQALVQLAFPDLAIEVQSSLDALADAQILDQVLGSPAALGMRERMRTQAATFLTTLPGRRRVLDSFLEVCNRVSLHDARSRNPGLGQKISINAVHLAFVAEILVHNNRLLPELESFRAATAKSPTTDNEIYRQARAALNAQKKLRASCEGLTPDHPVLHLPALILLNNLQRFDVINKYMALLPAHAEWELLVLGRASTGHLVGACRTMVEVLKALLPPPAVVGESLPEPELVVSEAARQLLDVALERFDQTLHLLQKAEFASERRSSMHLREHMNDLAATLTGPVAALASQRAEMAALSRLRPSPDHADVLWMLDFLCRWGRVLSSVGYASQEVENLRVRVGQDVERAFQQALRFRENDTLESRMEHLVRLNQILHSVGSDIGAWVSAVSQNMQQIINYYLYRIDEPTEEELYVIHACIESIRSELGKSRFWQSPELVALVREYDARWGEALPASSS